MNNIPRTLACTFLIVTVTLGTCPILNAQDLQALGTGLETVAKVYRQIATEYVDSTDPSSIASAGIQGMLTQLDPYSVFLQGSESEPYDRLSSGTYVGFGYTVGKVNNKLVITEVRPGLPAAIGGLLRGDQLCSVDGTRVDTLSIDSLLPVTRGAAGTSSIYRITRNGIDTISLTLTRKQIPVQNVGTASVLPDGIAYVELLRFSRYAASELADTLRSLQSTATLKGIVLDLRGNPGGLLEAAVSIANMFLPQGSLITFTKDRSGFRNEYLATQRPMDTETPLVVLIDEASASASEVLTGALQDQDRAVVVGRQSFGKGLVQNVFTVDDSSSVKLTTARYYSPSGRCVQRRFRQDKEQDSTSHFYSRKGRRVTAGSGIYPDSTVSDSVVPKLLTTLYRSGAFMSFASQYRLLRQPISIAATPSGKLVDEFVAYLEKQPDKLISNTLLAIRTAIDSAKSQHEPQTTIAALETARKAVIKDIVTALRTNSTLIGSLLRIELMACNDPAYNRNLGLISYDFAVSAARNLIIQGRYAGFLNGDSTEDQ